MAKPVSPVIVGLEKYEGEFQGAGTHSLPCLKSGGTDGIVTARWELTPEDREAIANGADVFVSIWTFGHGLPAQTLSVLRKDMDPEAAKTHFGIRDEEPAPPVPLVHRPKATVTKFAKKKPGKPN